MNNLRLEVYGIDRTIQSLQIDLYDELLLLWGNDIEGYGRVYRNIENSIEDVPEYYATSKIYIPEVYNSQTGDYQEVFYNDNFSAMFLFLPNYKTGTDDSFMLTNNIKLIFWLDLSKVYPNKKDRLDQKAQEEVYNLLYQINGDYDILGIETDIERIFREYSTNPVRFHDMQPYHCFSIDLNLKYNIKKYCNG